MTQKINIILTIQKDSYVFFNILTNEKFQAINTNFNEVPAKEQSSPKISCSKCQSSLEINVFCEKLKSTNQLSEKHLDDAEPKKRSEELWQNSFLNNTETFSNPIDDSGKQAIDVMHVDHFPTQRKQNNPISIQEIDKYLELAQLPKGLVLPDLYKIKAPYSKLHEQPDGTKVYVKKGRRELQIMNFDPRCEKCDLCGKTHLNGRNTLIIHRKDVHLFPNNCKKCEGCHCTFETDELRLIHSYFCLQKHTITVNYCKDCEYKASSYSEYRKHLRERHDNVGVKAEFVCHVCSAAFEYKKQLVAHILTHKDPMPYKCYHCSCEFKAKQGVWNHLVKVHFHQCAREICKICNPPVYFSHKHLYTDHFNAIHLKNNCKERQPCSICGKLVKRIKQHIKGIHKDRKSFNSKKFECRICQKIFFSNTSLKSHQAVHKTYEEMRFKCPHCDRGFDRHSFLLNHIRSHTGEKPFKCQICDKAYARKHSLVFHQREHTGERSDCPVCHIQIVDPRNFRRHLKHHENQLGVKLTLNREEWRLARLNIITTEAALRGRIN